MSEERIPFILNLSREQAIHILYANMDHIKSVNIKEIRKALQTNDNEKIKQAILNLYKLSDGMKEMCYFLEEH